MSLQFVQNMDPKSRAILQNEKHIGFLQWHTTSKVRVVFREAITLSVQELTQIVEEVKKHG